MDIEVASIIALNDFKKENGATRVILGSHRWDSTRKLDPNEAVSAEMPAGSALIYLGSTLHGAGKNTTESEWRTGMHVSFCLGWLRSEENNYLIAPLDFVRDLPTNIQSILGYAMHDATSIGGGYLGIYDLANPINLIADGKI
jgi:ectoine hydroxylase-related dioxygenase (phytanoyl-CoA dioxygenase family)